MDRDEEYVRRRYWSRDAKQAITEEAAASGSVVGTAKRHGIQAQQIYRWRDRLYGPTEPEGFLAVSVEAEPSVAFPEPVSELDPRRDLPALMLDGSHDRVEISSGNGVTVRLPPGSTAAVIVAIATGMARSRR